MTNDTTSKVWLVTGAGTGLGKAVVKYALSAGDKVCATARNTRLLDELEGKYPSSQLIICQLDVTSVAHIKKAFSRTIEAFGRVDAVYNNAGQATYGEVEAVDIENARKQFDVNFWGAVEVSKEAVRVFRDVNNPMGGVLIQASAITGMIGMPVIPFYCASKFALEGISEALSKELDPSWNIRVKILVLGGFNTGVLDRIPGLIAPLHPSYEGMSETGPVKATRAWLTGGYKPDGDPEEAARAIFDISRDANLSPIRVPLGQDALHMVGEKIEELQVIVQKAGKYSNDLKYT